MRLQQLWTTPVLSGQLDLTVDEMEGLKELGLRTAQAHKADPKPHTMPVIPGHGFIYHQNLLLRDDLSEHEEYCLGRLRSEIKLAYQAYLKAAYNVQNAEDFKIKVRIIPVTMEHNERTLPHYHHTCDHVACLYVDCGNDRPDVKNSKIGDGELLLQDPRPMASFPFWEKFERYPTHPGLFLIQPSRVWHETNSYQGHGTRLMYAITLRIESHNYTDLYCEL